MLPGSYQRNISTHRDVVLVARRNRSQLRQNLSTTSPCRRYQDKGRQDPHLRNYLQGIPVLNCPQNTMNNKKGEEVGRKRPASAPALSPQIR